jgi:pyruvate dehydrogenase E1 component alpha subunit
MTVEYSKEDLISMFELMQTMRRMEIACDTEYKARNIRGFCHLYIGQEAVATGIQYGMDPTADAWITSYRCHCVALARGYPVSAVVGELFGNHMGATKGKGGSMHFYHKKGNFFGGQGIVGAQVPVGAGLAFAAKYKAPPGGPMNVAIACYGDGAANQGQCWEAANMSSLWKLPMIFCIENNYYGMGTAMKRHSSITDYYKMGNHIPGLRIDGMNVLAVREGMRFAREWCSNGNGPMFVELMTYRYLGHSMSDSGKFYRTTEEIDFFRSTRDPLEFIKECLMDAGFCDEVELKEKEKEIRKHVQAEIVKAKESPTPPLSELTNHIFATSLEPQAPSEMPPHVRMPDYTKSIFAKGMD